MTNHAFKHDLKFYKSGVHISTRVVDNVGWIRFYEALNDTFAFYFRGDFFFQILFQIITDFCDSQSDFLIQ